MAAKFFFIFFKKNVATHTFCVNCFMVKKRTALFGGTFDPIHRGHTAVAFSAAEYVCADELIFVPACRSPLKDVAPLASGHDRMEMISRAIKKEKKFILSDYELKKKGSNYTLETVRHFRNHYGREAILYWLVGADSVDDLRYWYKIDELIDDCNLCVMYRAGYEKPTFQSIEKVLGKSYADKLEGNIIPTPLVDVSSTEIRKQLALGNDVTEMVGAEVFDYIRQHNLY